MPRPASQLRCEGLSLLQIVPRQGSEAAAARHFFSSVAIRQGIGRQPEQSLKRGGRETERTDPILKSHEKSCRRGPAAKRLSSYKRLIFMMMTSSRCRERNDRRNSPLPQPYIVSYLVASYFTHRDILSNHDISSDHGAMAERLQKRSPGAAAVAVRPFGWPTTEKVN